MKPKLRTITTGLKVVEHRAIKPMPKERNEFYVSSAWQTLMKNIIAKRGRQCQECGRTGTRIFGDHIVELQDGGEPLDENNIKLLCGSCHTNKTRASRAKRLAERFD